jgi:DNA-binding PadR family transcriptional regulator
MTPDCGTTGRGKTNGTLRRLVFFSDCVKIPTMLDMKLAILQVLLRQDAYGLQLIDELREMTGGRLVFAQARLYPALRELEADGLIASSAGEPVAVRAGRPRRYFRITAAGRKQAARDAAAIRKFFDFGAVARSGAR